MDTTETNSAEQKQSDTGENDPHFPVCVGAFVVGMLVLYTIFSSLLPSLNAYLSYRVLVMGLMGASALPVCVFLRRFEPNTASERCGIWTCTPGVMEARVTLLFIGVVTAYTAASFAFPVILTAEVTRILVLSASIICLLCYFAIAKILKRERVTLIVSAGVARSEGIARRFYTSLGIFLLFPLGMLSTLFFPSLHGHIATHIVFWGLTGAGLIGFWSVSKDVRELGTILEKASKVARGEVNDLIETNRDGELAELADAFNVIIAERDETIEKLEEAKQRIETLVKRIGTAVSSSGSLDELMNIVLDVCANALQVEEVYMLLEPNSGQERRMMTTDDRGTGGKGHRTARRRLRQVIQNGNSIRDEQFMAVPVSGTANILGALGIRKAEDSSFDIDTEEILRNVAGQAGLGLEAEHLRENEEKSYLEIITALAFTVEAKDPYTRGHSHRVSRMAAAIARNMDLSDTEVNIARDAALLHDIGKVGVPDDTLGNPGNLSATGWAIMENHPVMGEYIVKPVAGLQDLREPIRHHHERLDGSGYPDGLTGEDISVAARVLAVADTLDAMLTDRPYRDALDMDTAKQQIRDARGTQLDTDVVDAALRLIEEGRLPSEDDEWLESPHEVPAQRIRRLAE